MFEYKATSNPNATSQQNPMEQSSYYYYQALGRAIVGLEKALELRQGRIENVYTEDVLAYADIDPEEFKNVFKNPETLLRDVHHEIYEIMSDAANMPKDSNRVDRLTNVFQFLQKNCPMVRILRLTNDHNIWRMSLQAVVAGVATDWPPVNTPAWEYLYANFCCQFALIMEKWETANFSDTRLKDCVRLADVWLSADGMLGDTAETLLDDWTES